MHVQQFYRVAHHQRVGLAYIIRILSACQFNGCDYRLCRGQNSVFARRGNVGICAYEFCSRQNKTSRFCDLVVIVRRRFTHNNIIGVDVVHRKAVGIHCVDKPRFSYDICASARLLRGKKRCGCDSRRVKMLFSDIKPEPCEFLRKFTRRTLRRVGQKQIILSVFVQPLNKFLCARQKTVAVIYNTVHVAYKALFAVNDLSEIFFHCYLFFIR